MSLSAHEKLRVAHTLDELGIDLIEAGFPELQSQGARAVRAALARDLQTCSDRRIRDDATSRCPGAGRSGAADPRGLLRAGLHARRQDLEPAPGEGREGRPRREPADDLRVDRVPGRCRQARDLRRRALLRRRSPTTASTALACLRAAAHGRRRHRHLLRHQRRHAAGCDRDRDGRRWSGSWAAPV